MNVMTQKDTLQNILKWEQVNLQSREVVQVASGRSLPMGAVIGKITRSVPATGTAEEGNSGAGTVTAVTGGKKTKRGPYQITCLTYVASPLSATFSVKDPDGNLLPNAALGAYANEQIGFTITDGSPVIAVGDAWTIDVAPGSSKVTAVDFDALDGSETAYGFLIDACDATLADREAVAIVRDAQIVPDYLAWPAAATSDQKAAALSNLYAKNIVVRTEA